jgi:hypothetical protein
VPAPDDCEDGELFGGMKIGRGNRSTRRKPTPAPLRPPQIPLDQTRDRTRAAAVGSQRLTASAMARPFRRVSGRLEDNFKMDLEAYCCEDVWTRFFLPGIGYSGEAF